MKPHRLRWVMISLAFFATVVNYLDRQALSVAAPRLRVEFSMSNTEYGRVVVVVFLEGGRPTFGPKAAELAGHFYRNLEDHDFFASQPSLHPASTAGVDNSFR